MTDDPSPLRMWQPADYPMLAGWWHGHGWPAVPQRVLPPLGVIHDNSAAGWAYMDNGGIGVAMIEWLVTDPQASPIQAARSLSRVVEFLRSELRRMDYAIVLTTCRQESLARMLERQGFQRSDTGMIHLVGVL